MRKLLSIVCAVLLLLIVFLSAYGGFVALPEYWTGLAVGLTLIAIGGLSWGWKPEIERWLKERHIEEPQIRLIQHDFINTTRPFVKFDFEIIAGQLPIEALEVQVAYGYPNPLRWVNLDLREYSFTEAETGKKDEPVQRMSLLRNDVKKFTFVTAWCKDKKARIQATMRTIDSDSTLPANFKKISYLPWLRFYVRFIGLQKVIQKEYLIDYNEPPWGLSRTPIRLVEVDSDRGQELIANEKKEYG